MLVPLLGQQISSDTVSYCGGAAVRHHAQHCRQTSMQPGVPAPIRTTQCMFSPMSMTGSLTQTHPGLDLKIDRSPLARSTMQIMHTTHQSMSPSNVASCFGLSLTATQTNVLVGNASPVIATTNKNMMAESRLAKILQQRVGGELCTCYVCCEANALDLDLQSAVEIDRVGDELPWEL
jgi:hypothetical protein